MTSPTRRRLAIAATLLFAITTAAWFVSPRIDPRLVGQWANLNPDGFAVWRRFDPDGTHHYASDTGLGRPTSGGFWSVSGRTITFSQRSLSFGRAGSIRGWLYNVINRVRMGSGAEYYTILEVTPDTLRIESHSGAPIEEYRRN